MALYDNGYLNQNNMERSSAGVAKHISHDMVAAPLVSADVIVLGALPRESVTVDMRLLVTEAFDGTTPTFDVGFYDYNTGSFTDFATISATALGTADRQVVIPMPTSGNVDEAGTSYTGDRGGIWNGDKETVIAMVWNGGATSPTTGQAELLTAHEYYGTKDGKYGANRVPMTVYGN